MFNAVRYTFTQKFSVPVEEAFRWSLDYDHDDFSLMGLEGRRRINKLTDDTYILEDGGLDLAEVSALRRRADLRLARARGGRTPRVLIVVCATDIRFYARLMNP